MALKTGTLSRRIPTRLSNWFGPCASLACLAHCFSLPVLLLLAPGIFHFLPWQFIHDLELVFWIVAVELGIFALRNASVSLKWQRAFLAIALFAPVAVLSGSSAMVRIIFATMAIFQFVLVLRQHWLANSLQEELPHLECCEAHEHS